MEKDTQGDIFELLDSTQKKWAEREERKERKAAEQNNQLYKYTGSVSADEALTRIGVLQEAGRLDVKTVKAGNEYPTLFTRLPIFIPSKRRSQLESMDASTGISFKCSFGSGVRKGPALTTFDEDVFMALIRLRQRCIKGPQSLLPLSGTRGNDTVAADHLICSTRDILNFLGFTDGGNNYTRVVESVQNLAATTIELERRVVDRYFGEYQRGTSLRLFDLSWCVGKEEGVFEIQFEPIVTRWLAHEYTFINWTIRSQLNSPLAKSIHRYLSSQGKVHVTQLGRLASSVGYMGQHRNMKTVFRKAFEELQDVEFIKAWEISGTGRATPFEAKFWR